MMSLTLAVFLCVFCIARADPRDEFNVTLLMPNVNPHMTKVSASEFKPRNEPYECYSFCSTTPARRKTRTSARVLN